LELILASGATFIARGYPVRSHHFEKLLKEAVLQEKEEWIMPEIGGMHPDTCTSFCIR
jgi:hypothetical protein